LVDKAEAPEERKMDLTRINPEANMNINKPIAMTSSTNENPRWDLAR
jgi:hypothetical protein